MSIVSKMRVNMINLPVAIITIIFRKLFGTYTRNVKHKKLASGSSIIGDFLNSNNVYICIIAAALTYVTGKLKTRLFANLVGRCPTQKQTCWMRKNKAWLIKNLLGSRVRQERAVKLMTSKINIEDATTQRLIEALKKEVIKETVMKAFKRRKDIRKSNKTSNYSVVDDGAETKSKEKGYGDIMKPSDVKEASISTDKSFSRPDKRCITKRSVVKKIVCGDDSEDDVIEKIRAKRQRSRRTKEKETRSKKHHRVLRGELRRTRSGRAYNVDYLMGV